jgi:hypothetical protein
MKSIKIYIISLLSCFGMISMTSCEKQLEVENVFLMEEAVTNVSELDAYMRSIYDVAANVNNGNYQIFSDLPGDDLAKPYNDGGTFRTEAYTRTTTIFNTDLIGLYTDLYRIVYRANNLDLIYPNIVDLTDAVKSRTMAEAAFLRAYAHYKVLLLWAQPAGYTSDNSHLGIVIRKEATASPIARSSVDDSYKSILEDLDFAIANLPSTNGIYADIDAAKALKALVLFQMNDYTNSLPLLNEILDGGRFTLSDSIDRYYANNFSATNRNSEFIFGFSSPGIGDNRGGNLIGSYRVAGAQPSLSITKDLFDLLKSDSTDIRGNLVEEFNSGQASAFYGVKKYNDVFFGTPAYTYTQLLFSRAEILARNGSTIPAVTDLNRIIARAYPTNPTKLLALNASQDDILNTLVLERRKEFFAEGDRLSYLRRLGAFYDRTGTKIRGANWDCDGLSFQFPSNEKSAVFIFNPTANCN